MQLHEGKQATLQQVQSVALNQQSNSFSEFLPTLRSGAPGYAAVLIDDSEIRRFTITELERCMGFPDGWTEFEWNGEPASYRTRAALLGNAFSPAILHWVGGGIAGTHAMAMAA